MDFKQLESFVAITKHGSFTKAAEELYLTQPTLTGHIQALEAKLGTVLLNRCGKVVTLTDAGKILYNYAVNILNTREQAFFSLAQYEGKLEGELAIAASTVPQGYILPGLLAAFNRAYPDIGYIIRQYDSRGVVEAIVSGIMDFGFVGTRPSYPELEILRLCKDYLVLITPAKGKFKNIADKELTWEQVRNERFILREEGSATRAIFLEALGEKGIMVENLHIVANIENPETIKGCVREGLGVAIVSQRSVEEDISSGLLKSYYISDLGLQRHFYFICHKNRVLSPIARAFRDFTVQYRQGL
ncbi:MAG: LysR family transcriptional regulator [Firmicutes bacterium]|nr:LysR family transcriptional regulator [Bacillota bacterium]